MRRVPRGCAYGPDGLPGELCHHQLSAIARLLCPGLLKTMVHGHEPLVFKGEVLTAAYITRGKDQLTAGDLLDQCLSRLTWARRYTDRLGSTHTASIYTSNQSLLLSCQAMWTETFYRAFREVPLGGNITDELLAHLMHKLRMPEDSLHDIHDLLQEKPAIELAGLDPLHQRCFRAIHLSTHFSMRNQHDASRTTMGTRSQNWHRL